MKDFKLVGETTPRNIQRILDRPKNTVQSWYVIPRLNGTVEVYISRDSRTKTA